MEKENLFYRLKSSWTGEADNGALKTMKSEDLILATCYTDAEKVAMAILADKQEFGSVTYDIVKTKIGEILFNSAFCCDQSLTAGLVTCYFEEDEDSTEEGLYSVSVLYTEEVNGKNKTSKESIYVPAISANDAINFVKAYLTDVETRDWLIRDVKFDKAQSVMVTPEYYQSNIDKCSKYDK